LSKFFDAEAADYKKEVEAKDPNYNRLLEKAGDKVLDFAMRSRIVTLDRDADRRYDYATRRAKELEEKGELFPQSSPMEEVWEIPNETPEEHEAVKKLFEKVKAEMNDDKFKLKDVPPVGERFTLVVPMQLVNQLNYAQNLVIDSVKQFKENHTEAEVEKVMETTVAQSWGKVTGELIEKYSSARAEVEGEVDKIKTFFRSQTADKYKTKADVLRALWAELPKVVGKEIAPVDEELLAELEQRPAVVEGEFRHIWGTADTLYKSEAIDAFGQKYLLGIFETQDEAKKAFDEWNAEYESARKDMKVEMEQWSKQENARLDADTASSDRIKKILEEARR
jgi:hypothetical protein